MHAAEDSHRGLEERIEKLERQNRRWKIGGIARLTTIHCAFTRDFRFGGK